VPFPRTRVAARSLSPAVAIATVIALAATACGGGSGSHAAGPTTSAGTAPASVSAAPTSAASSSPATSAAASTSAPASVPPSVAPSASGAQPSGGTGGTRKPVPTTRAVHITGAAWDYKPKHDAVMALLKAHRINAIEVDIKDETGIVNYASDVPLASTIGAVAKMYDVKAMVAEIHAAGGRVIGREVVFHDSKLAKWSWDNGHKDDVLQTSGHQPWKGSYGDFSFTNFASPTVQQYNVDLAVEAAKDGFDDVLFDYVRRADGKLSEMYVPGLTGTPEQAVADFVKKTRQAFTVAGVSTFIGASVFGIAATRPKEIAQDIPMMAPYLDYVAPMVYPSHWGSDEYGLKDPVQHPYDIVQRSLKDFQKDVKGTGATVVPWLQAFTLGGVHYGTPEVLAQEKGAHDDGLDGFLLWNAGADYVAADLPPM
jgi:hypothetical protein